jgi:hypothetical protein
MGAFRQRLRGGCRDEWDAAPPVAPPNKKTPAPKIEGARLLMVRLPGCIITSARESDLAASYRPTDAADLPGAGAHEIRVDPRALASPADDGGPLLAYIGERVQGLAECGTRPAVRRDHRSRCRAPESRCVCGAHIPDAGRLGAASVVQPDPEGLSELLVHSAFGFAGVEQRARCHERARRDECGEHPTPSRRARRLVHPREPRAPSMVPAPLATAPAGVCAGALPDRRKPEQRHPGPLGGIGRRSGFKIRGPKGCPGSNPGGVT